MDVVTNLNIAPGIYSAINKLYTLIQINGKECFVTSATILDLWFCYLKVTGTKFS